MAEQSVEALAVGPVLSDRTRKNAGWVFSEIAELAHNIERLGVLLASQGSGYDADPRDAAAFSGLVKSTAAQIGLLADFGCEMVKGVPMRGAQLEEWLLPPVYERDTTSGRTE